MKKHLLAFLAATAAFTAQASPGGASQPPSAKPPATAAPSAEPAAGIPDAFSEALARQVSEMLDAVPPRNKQ